ncbi:MAG TPA: hypothetical protein VGC76_19460 [Pyrinomonadaceae bacterium]|jgi:hypothetical protein
MSKIFGYTKKGGKGWFNSDAYSTKEIEAIRDPEGGGEISLPTAIPSPFARIDLVKTAFRNIAETPELKAFTDKEGIVRASKNDEKLVSDCLDIAEMLFNYNNLRDKINFIVWDKEVELPKLKAASPKHRRFAETLELYLDQDKDSYNFDKFTKLYLIEYNHKIIGCTSPVTLFFTTANDLTHAQIQLTSNDVLFDEKYASLYERDPQFQKYFYLLFTAYPALSQLMPDFYNYLEQNKEILEKRNYTFYSELNTLDPADYKKLYAELNTGTAGSEIQVLNGVGLRKSKSEDIIEYISKYSDFRIASTKLAGGNRPLVLQNDFSKDWLYAKDKWHKFKVPFTESAAMDKRRLPGINVPYPYLTISDFLEPYLIRMVYPINKDKFFDGNLIAEVGDDSKGYILPLKKQFFDYFTAEELVSGGGGKPSIKMIQGVANSVKVVLKIPVAKSDEYITFERTYFESAANQISKPDEEYNKGVVIEHEVGITLFPFIKTRNPNIYTFYRIQLIDRDYYNLVKDNDYRLDFYTNQSPKPVKIVGEEPKIRSIKGVAGSDATSKYYVLENEFDFIQIKSSVASGIILPNWEPFHQGQDEFSFAVDFGTTNTHIEYKVGKTVKPFDIIKSTEIQIATLFHPEKTSEDSSALLAISGLIEHEFVPSRISKDLTNSKYIYKFPQRTVISESQSLDIGTQPLALADFNIPFAYEKKRGIGRIQSNLKWAAAGDGNEERIRAFFEEIIMLLRNKVLLNNGNLSKTKLYWFYPSSMTTGRVGTLRNEWNALFTKYFNAAGGTTGITESMAPFFYFKNEEGGGSFKPIVSIDIGGGTTDVVVFKGDKPVLLTSFKCAANAIFGDGFSEYGTKSNGLVNKYLPRFESLLEKNSLTELLGVLSSIKEKSKNEDINAFFFSIEDNPKIQAKQQFSYNSILSKDEDLKIIFVYFYSAIIYHIAALMRSENIALPKKMIFSGTGSKILNIITTDLPILAELSKKIFEEIYHEKFEEGLTIKTEKNTPKEVTCKGGLMVTDTDDLEKINIGEIKAILTCLENNKTEKSTDSVSEIETPAAPEEPGKINLDNKELCYRNLNDSVKQQIAAYVEKFNSFFTRLTAQYKFTENFNITEKSLRIFKNEFNKDVRDNLEAGLEYTRKLDAITDEDREIGETLFFYPIIGTINRVTRILSEQKDNE